MKQYIFSALTIILGFSLNSQILLTGPDYPTSNPLNYSAIVPPAGGTNFSDGPANYLPNMNEVITFCPDLTQGSKVSIVFATNIGFTFDVHPTDTLYVYDGPSISSPLLGAYNSGTIQMAFLFKPRFKIIPAVA